MIKIEVDILDATVTTPGQTVVVPAESFIPVINQSGSASPYLVPPSKNCLMLRPIQLLPSWNTQPKFMPGDFSSPTGWEAQEVRGNNDYWMHTGGTVSGLALAYTFPANTGWFVEFRGYATPKSLPEPILDFVFGGYFQVVLWSDGNCQLYDSRVGYTSPIGQGNISHGQNFVNKDASLLVLPYKRGRLLIWSPTLGGWFETSVTVGQDGNITEACAPAVYSSVTPSSAFVALSPLLYPADGIAVLDSPPYSLQHPLAVTPTFTHSVIDQPGKATCVLAAITPYVPNPPVTSFIFSVTMQGNSGHQTAEAQGVQGIGAATATTTGDSIFSGGTYPYSLTTPFLYTAIYGYDRVLGPNEYTSNLITNILSAKLTLSKNRAEKSFEFVIDNPGDIWTSLKDLENRRCRAWLTSPTMETEGATDAQIAADPDPDTPLIVANGSQPVLLFDGYTDNPGFTDGTASEVRMKCQGLRKRLKNYHFSDQPIYDGWKHTDVAVDILRRALFVGEADTVSGMETEIFTVDDDTLLPSALPGATPLFQPALGANAEDFFATLMQFTGWILDDVPLAGASNSVWYWMPVGYMAEHVYTTTPEVYMVSQYNKGFGEIIPIPDATRPNQGIASIMAIDDPMPEQTTEEQKANIVVVIGLDDNGNPVVAQAIDWPSITDRTDPNYLSGPRILILYSETINSQASANLVCSILFQNCTQPNTHLDFTTPDYYPAIGIGGQFAIQNYWTGTIEGIVAEFEDIGFHKTTYTVKKNVT